MAALESRVSRLERDIAAMKPGPSATVAPAAPASAAIPAPAPKSLALSEAWSAACDGAQSFPLEVAGSRHFVAVTLRGPKATETVRFHVDTGGNTPGLMLFRSVAQRLGFDSAEALPQTLSISGHDIAVPKGASWIVLDDGNDEAKVMSASRKGFSLGQIGAGFLSRFLVCIDPARGRMGVVDPDAWQVDLADATAIPILLSKGGRNGASYPFVKLLFKLHGQFVGGYDALLDTGATFSMLGRQWHEYQANKHPDWPRAKGTAGDADMIGGAWPETMLQVPDVVLTSPGMQQWEEKRPAEDEMQRFFENRHEVAADAAVFVDRSTDTFREMFGRVGHSGGPHGAVANDILNRFRILLDYRGARLWLEPATMPPSPSASLTRVGVSLAFDDQGCAVIKQVTSTNARDTLARLKVGDVILKVDGDDACGLFHHEIAAKLAGKPGEHKKVQVRRGKATLDTTVSVAELLH